MGLSAPIQTSFAVGELSRRLRGHIGSELYQRALDFCENFEPTPQGSLLSRGGTETIYALPNDPSVRLIPFRSTARQDYLAVLNALELRIFTAVGIFSTGGADLIANGTFDSGASWTMVPGGGVAVIGGGALHIGSHRRTVSVKPPEYEYDWGSAYQDTAGGAGDWTLTFDVTVPDGVTLEVLITSNGGATIHLDEVVNASGTATFNATLQPVATRISFIGAGDIVATIDIDNVSLVQGAVPMAPLVAPWTAAQLEAIQYVQEPGKNRMFLAHENVPTQQLTISGAWALAAVTFVAKPASWDATNWPRACEIHQGRLLLAGTPSDSNQLWASKAGVPDNFTTGVNPEDSFNRQLWTAGAILWMRSASRLVAGTNVGETLIFSSGAILKDSDVGAKTQSQYGSSEIQAIRVGTRILFVSGDRRRVRALEYAQQQDSVVGLDLTFQAEHMTEDEVKELHYARDPDNLVFLVMKSGKVIACTYSHEREVIAWWRLTTEGSVRSAAVTEGPGGSILWLAVQRRAGVFLERMYTSSLRHVRLDAQLTRVPDVNGLITDLANLEGEFVDVILDGALEKQSVQVVGGQIQLAVTGAKALVGIPYTCKARTLPKDTRTGKARVARIGLLLNNSAVPLLNGQRAPERGPATPWDTPTALGSGKVRVGNVGWDTEAMIEIVQDLPFRTEVLALYEVTAANAA